MSAAGSHDRYSHAILRQLESGESISQRSLARSIGIALGLTNLLVRRLVLKGWIRIVRIKPNRVSYVITPAGIAEKARMARRYFSASVAFYAETRGRVRGSLSLLSRSMHNGSSGKRIAFFGAGEVAEIGYVCLQETDLRLVRVFDETHRATFFGMPVEPTRLLKDANGDAGFDRLVVMSFTDPEEIEQQLQAMDFPLERTFWI